MNNNKIDILGTTYTISTDAELVKENNDGICTKYDKSIVLRPENMMLSDTDNLKAKELRFKEVLRHEVMHAFFSESGLDCYSDDECLVSWLAVQLPKVYDVFIQLGVI